MTSCHAEICRALVFNVFQLFQLEVTLTLNYPVFNAGKIAIFAIDRNYKKNYCFYLVFFLEGKFELILVTFLRVSLDAQKEMNVWENELVKYAVTI